ncbi:MAG: hypothetical protein GWN84_24725 [Gammaproteobacteria bacterium]|nr:hypothetical protein [Gammaproteobacteria bacterium]NIR60612.1 hypothetical protein [Gammaproteobacteria bacterium]
MTAAALALGLGLALGALGAAARSAGPAPEAARRAAHPSIGPEALAELAQADDPRVREAVASNRRTPPDVLHELAHDPAAAVRIAVATNLSTAERTFLHLAEDPDARARSVVSRFEYVPASALRRLAGDRDPAIRLEVARDLNTPPEALETLADDELADVRSIARQALSRTERATPGPTPPRPFRGGITLSCRTAQPPVGTRLYSLTPSTERSSCARRLNPSRSRERSVIRYSTVRPSSVR